MQLFFGPVEAFEGIMLPSTIELLKAHTLYPSEIGTPRTYVVNKRLELAKRAIVSLGTPEDTPEFEQIRQMMNESASLSSVPREEDRIVEMMRDPYPMPKKERDMIRDLFKNEPLYSPIGKANVTFSPGTRAIEVDYEFLLGLKEKGVPTEDPTIIERAIGLNFTPPRIEATQDIKCGEEIFFHRGISYSIQQELMREFLFDSNSSFDGCIVSTPAFRAYVKHRYPECVTFFICPTEEQTTHDDQVNKVVREMGVSVLANDAILYLGLPPKDLSSEGLPNPDFPLVLPHSKEAEIEFVNSRPYVSNRIVLTVPNLPMDKLRELRINEKSISKLRDSFSNIRV
jgi:hypothetical protein